MHKAGNPVRVTAIPSSFTVDYPRPRDFSRGRWVSAISQISQLILDVLMLVIGFYLAFWIPTNTSFYQLPAELPITQMRGAVGIAVISMLVVFTWAGLYQLARGTSRVDELYKVSSHLTLSLLIAIASTVIIFGPATIVSRRLLLIAVIISLGSVASGRLLHGLVLGHLRAQGIGVRRLLIVGTGQTGQIIFNNVQRSPALGYEIAGFIHHSDADSDPVPPRTIESAPVFGTTNRIAEVVRRHRVDELIIALEGTPHNEVLDLIYNVIDLPVSIKVYPDTFRLMTNDELSIGDLGGLPMMSVRALGLRPWDRTIKRTMDIAISTIALVLLSPLMLFVALLVKLDSRGPVFYMQQRVGHDGRPFNLLKFRSMPVGAEQQTGPVFAQPGDRRTTRFGAFMRRYSLDELPQFINVLSSEMSLVGPRPERPYFVEQFSQTIPRYMVRHREKAGITGWAQVNGLRGDTSVEERTRFDLYYVENWSILFDVKILIKTLVRIFNDQNAY